MEKKRKSNHLFLPNPKTRNYFQALKAFKGAQCLGPLHTEITLAHLFHTAARLVLTSLITKL